jgi:hypothetical protein
MGNLIFTFVFGGSIMLYGVITEIFLRKLEREGEEETSKTSETLETPDFIIESRSN